MFDFPFDVSVLSAGCVALLAGIGMSLVNLKTSIIWMRKWRIGLAIGCATGLLGGVLGIVRMTTPWHPYSGELCAFLLAGSAIVLTIATLGCGGIFGTDQ